MNQLDALQLQAAQINPHYMKVVKKAQCLTLVLLPPANSTFKIKVMLPQAIFTLIPTQAASQSTTKVFIIKLRLSVPILRVKSAKNHL